MTQPIQTTAPHLELAAATAEDAPVLSNLLELYVHDFSEFLDLEIGDDGRFGFPPLEPYWSEPDRHAFLVKADGRLAGFVMVATVTDNRDSGAVWDMAQFFILRRWRRRGIGTRAAHEVWRRFPARWQVRVMPENRPALDFWADAISAFVGEVIQPVLGEADGECRSVFSFESRSEA
jgi:predicted acetyltransferase